MKLYLVDQQQTLIDFSLEDNDHLQLKLFDDAGRAFVSLEGRLYGGVFDGKNDLTLTINPSSTGQNDSFVVDFVSDISYEEGSVSSIKKPTKNLKNIEELSQLLGIQP